MIQQEPIDFIDPELRGLAASIGIVKGKEFAPDERMKKILTDAVAIANGTARAIAFRNRDPRAKSSKTANGRAALSVATITGSGATVLQAAISMPAPFSSTSPR